jgi:UDP-N-acetylglucosamine 3-dehydrogenase
MPNYSAAAIAVGAQGRVHLNGYQQRRDVTIVAVADVDRARAEAVAREVGATAVYEDYRDLLANERIDLLSVCTPPALHRDVVTRAVDAGVRAIHCEKPMALSYGDAAAMRDYALDHGVLLSVNHQRRFETLYRQVRVALESGAIGELESIEGYCSNLFDWGSHIMDLILFFMADEKPETVFGQIDVDTRRHIYGALTETASVTHLHWPGGMNATVFTGRGPEHLSTMGDTGIVLNGSGGRARIAGGSAVIRGFDGSQLDIESQVQDRYRVEMGGVDPTIIQGTADAIGDLIDALENGTTPVLDSAHGLAAAELIFATYESSARRGSVRLPLEQRDNALLRGLDAGYWAPRGESFGTY